MFSTPGNVPAGLAAGEGHAEYPSVRMLSLPLLFIGAAFRGAPVLTGAARSTRPVSEEDAARPEDRATGEKDEDVFEAIYLRQKRQLTNFFRRRCRSNEEVAELLQETFLRFLKVPAQRLRSLDRPEAYLSTIAGNLLRDHAKAESRRKAAYESYAQIAPTPSDELCRLEARDMIDRLESAMASLRPKTREIFMAHRLDGLTYGEIAAQTGLSIKTVEKHMSRAIAHLDRVRSRQR